MPPRRLNRTASQLFALIGGTVLFLFFLDSRWRVLPETVHDHLPGHHAGMIITDITTKFCSTLNPLSSCVMDPSQWQRVEKDLYLDQAWTSAAYVHVSRKREEDLIRADHTAGTEGDRVVMDVRIGKLDPSVSEASEANEQWESRPGGLWLKRSSKRHDADTKDVVTAVDVLFGDDAVDPRPGWEIKENSLRLDNPPDQPPARLSIRRGPPHKIEKTVPRVKKNEKFKILQVSDLHLSTGVGKCREPEPPELNGNKCEADTRTLEFVGRILDDEKPDMVVLSGDQVNGETAPDAQSAIYKFADLFIKRSIPFATIYGNHDDEGSLNRAASMALTEGLPFSVSTAGPNTLSGVGNYYVEVLAHSTTHSAMTLYFLDSHSYSRDESHYKGYDWIQPDQIAWFESTASALKQQESHKRYPLIRVNMAFIHIPLPEYRDEGPGTEGAEIFGWKDGETKEDCTAPGYNSRFRDSLVNEGVSIVSCGHDHVNSHCILSRHTSPNPASPDSPAHPMAHSSSKKDPALWMCYAGGSGFGGYGGGNWGSYHRRVRVFELDAQEGKITTWKRLECCGADMDEKKDLGVIVQYGKAVVPHAKTHPGEHVGAAPST